jgi:hypothetical protein
MLAAIISNFYAMGDLFAAQKWGDSHCQKKVLDERNAVMQ